MVTNDKYKHTSVVHHCAKASEGNCRRMKGVKYCVAHNRECPKHAGEIHLKDQICMYCARATKRAEAEAKEAARLAKIQKDLEHKKASKGGNKKK